MDGLRLAAEISGVILAVVAIVLSIKFFQLSEMSARRLDDTAKNIQISVARLEPILAQLYSDAFALVKDTMGDFRAHAWDNQPAHAELTTQVEERAEAKVEEIRQEISTRIERLTVQIQHGEKTQGKLGQEISSMVETAIERSRSVDAEARSETLHAELSRVYGVLSANGTPVRAIDLIRSLIPPFDFGDLAEEILELRRAGVLSWNGDLSHESIVTMQEG